MPVDSGKAHIQKNLIPRTEAVMYDDFAVHEWQIAELISEQAKLARKKTALTCVEKWEFRVRARKIRRLLLRQRREIQSGRRKWQHPLRENAYLS